MAKAVTLKNSNSEEVYPVTDISLVNGGIYADILANVEPTTGYISTAMLQDEAVISDKIDWATIRVPLYSGGTYQSASASLSDSPSNYEYLFIETITNDNIEKVIMVPSGASRFTSTDVGYANNNIYIKWAEWETSGTTITRQFSCESTNYGNITYGSYIGVKNVYGIKLGS